MPVWFRKTLIVCPHFDDEVISCGGIIARLSELGHDVSVLVMCEHRKPVEPLIAQCHRAMNLLGVSADQVVHSNMPHHRNKVLVLDQDLLNFQPTAVLIPYPSHHQDHQMLYDVCCSALRPRPDLLVEFVGMYEYPYADAWPNRIPEHRMVVSIHDQLMRKTSAMRCYDKLDRLPENHPVSVKNVVDFAKRRGQEVGASYGEAIYPLRCLV